MDNSNVVSAVQNPEFIAIDWEVHQLIERERKGFTEAPLSALRRLLGLDVTAEAPAPVAEKQRVRVRAAKKPEAEKVWTEGLTIPNGTKARFNYRRGTRPIYGEFVNGMLVAAGREYDSLSKAANDLATTRNGKKTRLNGWLYWAIEVPGGSGNWVILDNLRGK